MHYGQLGTSSLQSSVLGIGGLHFGLFCDQADTTRIIYRALDLGINFIDTAPLYGQGHSETLIKNAIQGRRDKVLLSTKVGLEPHTAPDGTFGVSVTPLTQNHIRRSLEKSLIALGTDYIDLYQVHAFDPNTPIQETLETLTVLVREGKVRFVGCSNYDHMQLQEASAAATKLRSVQFVSCQVHYNLLERRAEQDIVPLCLAIGSGIICNRALARGILTGKYQVNQPLPVGSRAVTSFRVRRWLDESTLLIVEALGRFAREHGRTVTELAIAWLLARQAVSVVLVGVRNLDQLESCARAVEWLLSDDELFRVEEIVEQFDSASRVRAMPETFFEQ